MFTRRIGLFLVTVMALLAIVFIVRIGQAQKSPPAPAPAGSHATLASNVPVIGHAVGFAETRPVRELMDQVSKVDLELKEELEEKGELNTVFDRKANPHAPAQKDGALQSSFGPDGRFQLNIPNPIVVFE